ncbi:limbic system-associated membrane protein-like [Penaeus monodon]|uniref:limbic system-associated membrane protein-like n=1 Tax=Penaeus monodon TaxID=6687 RepID=UPI0018A7955A|nr:limbic system-associated membrane protein-like [Penaeus monodon]
MSLQKTGKWALTYDTPPKSLSMNVFFISQSGEHLNGEPRHDNLIVTFHVYGLESVCGGSPVLPRRVRVTFGPEDVKATKRVVVEKGGSATLLCSANGNPTPTITWTRDVDGDGSLGERLATGDGEARVAVTGASRADSGRYLCTAFSVAGAAPPLETFVVVKQAPWSTHKEMEGDSWAAAGGEGRLECRVRAFPKPSFTWKHKNNTTLSSGDKYDIRKTQLEDGVVEWSSVLSVKGVVRGDYGNYSCVARNILGSHATSLALVPPPTPAAPTNLTVSRAWDIAIPFGPIGLLASR